MSHRSESKVQQVEMCRPIDNNYDENTADRQAFLGYPDGAELCRQIEARCEQNEGVELLKRRFLLIRDSIRSRKNFSYRNQLP